MTDLVAGQQWRIRQDNRRGWREVTILSADDHWVVVKGARTSRIRRVRWTGPRYELITEEN